MMKTYKLTMSEILECPSGMHIEEYAELLNWKRKTDKRICKLSEDIDFEEDALEVLADEKGSERFNRHIERLKELRAKRDTACEEYEAIKAKLDGKGGKR